MRHRIRYGRNFNPYGRYCRLKFWIMNPEGTEKMYFKTPDLAHKPDFDKSDLPIKVKVYYYQHAAYATEIL